MPENPSALQEIADAVKQLVGLPEGQRPLRTVVGVVLTAGVEELSRAGEKTTCVTSTRSKGYEVGLRQTR